MANMHAANMHAMHYGMDGMVMNQGPPGYNAGYNPSMQRMMQGQGQRGNSQVSPCSIAGAHADWPHLN